MGIEKIALIAAAVAVVFWPQIAAAAKHLRGAASAWGASTPTPAGPSRSGVVVQLLDIQSSLEADGKANAAKLVGQAVVELVSAPKPQVKR